MKRKFDDTAYIEYSSAKWNVWTYSEGLRISITVPSAHRNSEQQLIRYLNNKKYDVVVVR